MGKQNTILSIMSRLIIQENGCCLWPGKLDKDGYGRVAYKGRRHPVHRLLYERFVGPIPPGYHAHHTCQTPGCGNFAHIEPLSPKAHIRRCNSPAARNAEKTHCPRGHPLSGANLRMHPSGSRICRTCQGCVFVKATTTHCRRGHPYKPEVLALKRPKLCHICAAMRMRRYRSRPQQG